MKAAPLKVFPPRPAAWPPQPRVRLIDELFSLLRPGKRLYRGSLFGWRYARLYARRRRQTPSREALHRLTKAQPRLQPTHKLDGVAPLWVTLPAEEPIRLDVKAILAAALGARPAYFPRRFAFLS